MIHEFADRYVVPADYRMYLQECEELHIRQRVAAEKTYSITFRRYNDLHVMEYVQMTISRVDDEKTDRIVMGYKDVTNQVKKAQEELNLKHTGFMLRSVAEDYVCLIDVDLQTEKEILYFLNRDMDGNIPWWSDAIDYSTNIRLYAEGIVAEKDRDRFLEASDLAHLLDVLSKQRECSIEYDAVIDGCNRKCQNRFILHEEEPGEKHLFIGIRDITEAEQLRFE